MNFNEIQNIARTRGIRPLPKAKLTLVRAIQADEGNFPCFGTAFHGIGEQEACLWRNDCFKASRAALVSTG
jgi:hypothetical protein